MLTTLAGRGQSLAHTTRLSEAPGPLSSGFSVLLLLFTSLCCGHAHVCSDWLELFPTGRPAGRIPAGRQRGSDVSRPVVWTRLETRGPPRLRPGAELKVQTVQIKGIYSLITPHLHTLYTHVCQGPDVGLASSLLWTHLDKFRNSLRFVSHVLAILMFLNMLSSRNVHVAKLEQ